MTWYFNNKGVADGPYEDEAMEVLFAQQRISPKTLVWHTEAEAWKELSRFAPSWWQAEPVSKPAAAAVAAPVVVPVLAKQEDVPTTSRSLVPIAPVSDKKHRAAAKPGFFKRLFGGK